MIVPVILAGGSGTRLWPLSRRDYPKQFLPLVSGQTMLQETVLRARLLAPDMQPLIICNQEHRFLVAEQLRQIDITDALILLEPEAKNTAPAAAVAAFYALNFLAVTEQTTLLLMPADHVIGDNDAFRQAVQTAQVAVADNKLVTFGIQPRHPETGYGYIQAKASATHTAIFDVVKFVEKPSLAVANEYIAAGDYYWNSGLFMFDAKFFLQELKTFAPAMHAACEQAVRQLTWDLDFLRLDQAAFAASPADSIDYAIMEKTSHAAMVPFDAGWSDVGSWSALGEILPADAAGNVIVGDVIQQDVTHSYLRAEQRLLAVQGLANVIVVATEDAVLVADRQHAQNIKDLVNRLKVAGRSEVDSHQKVYRPWGYYESLDKSAQFQVKHIHVKPGAALSLQMHYHRSEHWIVVHGTAEVTRGDEVFMITANQSTYIPQRVKHRLANPGPEELVLIEVQSGSYLGEDDIVRFADDYGRVETVKENE